MLVRASRAFDLKVSEAGIQRVADGRERRSRRANRPILAYRTSWAGDSGGCNESIGRYMSSV